VFAAMRQGEGVEMQRREEGGGGVAGIPPAHVRGEDWVEQRTPSGSRWERRGGGRRMSRNLALHKRPPNVSITATTRKHAQH
jgi:hypothetical protein